VTTEPLVALSIDLDALDFYQGLYGLQEPLSEQARQAIPARAIERFCDLCAELGIPGTLFVVGRDLAAGHGRGELRVAAAGGHEVASHSFSHDYALSRRSPAEIDADLAQAEAVIRDATGRAPVGFRAPGYTLSNNLRACIAQRGYLYDSSLFPSPPYYAAKATVIGGLTLLGKRSHSILGPVGQLFRPRGPHRDDAGFMELPVAVVPGLRVPYYGTVVTLFPEPASGALAGLLRWDPLVVLELHGVDLCDASDGVPRELLARQRDLQVPASVKRRRIETAMRSFLRRRRGVTLAQAAQLVSQGTAP
jgi:hypothetical protein